MKKTRFPALILVLALLCSALVCGAATLSVDCTVDGIQKPLSVEAGKVVLPEAPAYADGRIFLGWYAEEESGQKVFLPAGADYAPQGSVSFEAIAVRMETAGKGSARVAGQEVGVRFTSEIRRADYEKLALRLGRENFSFGTYIVAAEYLAGTKNVFTPEALAAAGYDRYIDVPTTGYYEKTNSAYVWAGSVTAIRPGNYTREYAGIGYISLTYTDGTSARILCPFSAKKHVQMASETVLMSYEDRSIYYDYLILDLGTSTEDFIMDEFLRCDRKILLGSLSPWRQICYGNFLTNFLKTYQNHGTIVYDGSLKEVNGVFGQDKLLKFQLGSNIPEKTVANYGTIVRHEHMNYTLRVPKGEVKSCAMELLQNLPINDFNVEDIPVEEGIAKLYKKEEG